MKLLKNNVRNIKIDETKSDDCRRNDKLIKKIEKEVRYEKKRKIISHEINTQVKRHDCIDARPENLEIH